MDNELHYVTYDPEEIWDAMTGAYISNGGSALWAGDEKEMLLRAVQNVLTTAFAGIDNALRMATLRYAVREYLDIYGETRDCPRIQATAATATVRVTLKANGTPVTIPAGTAVTADGEVLYTLDEAIQHTGYSQNVTVGITCSKTGTVGNSLATNTNMQTVTSWPCIQSITVTDAASGGNDLEDDESYRERIRQSGSSAVTTGPAEQYEAAARAASSDVIDANAVNGGAGTVNVYLLLASGADSATVIRIVTDALNSEDTRPLTDSVSVSVATAKTYTLNIQYKLGEGATLADLTAAKDAYLNWQNNTIGRAFDPDRLIAALYQAGADRAVIGTGSTFDGGTAEYTEITSGQRCSGTVTLEAMST